MVRLTLVCLLLALTPAVAAAQPLISYEREGGFRADPLAVTVSPTGRARPSGGAAFQLSPKRLRGLRTAIAEARFGSLQDSYAPEPGTIADGFTERVRYRGRTVETGTGGDAPPRLQRLLDRLSTLAQRTD